MSHWGPVIFAPVRGGASPFARPARNARLFNGAPLFGHSPIALRQSSENGRVFCVPHHRHKQASGARLAAQHPHGAAWRNCLGRSAAPRMGPQGGEGRRRPNASAGLFWDLGNIAIPPRELTTAIRAMLACVAVRNPLFPPLSHRRLGGKSRAQELLQRTELREG